MNAMFGSSAGRAHRFVRALLVGVCLAFPVSAFAQGTAAISGMVRDTSGAVLPGVTVEAASAALIEKARTAISDGSGQYKIVSLPPGL